MQSSIEDFFTMSGGSRSRATTRDIPKYYYLYKNMNIYNAVWTDTKPDTILFHKEIKWKNNGIVTICSNFICNGKETNNNINHKYIPILKSNLQKCIRRNETENALKTSKTLIKLNIIQFIRRLSIIMLEDCILHESFMVLSWFIAAYPHFESDNNDIQFLLGIVKYLGDLIYRDYYDKIESFNIQTIIKSDKLSSEHKSILYSLQFRASYGGLKGDICMINSLTEIWQKRMETNKLLSHISNKITPYSEKISYIKKNEINIASVDFHCFTKILQIIQEKYPQYELELIKKAIWFHSSRNTTKSLLENTDLYDSKYIDIWNNIKIIKKQISVKYLENL